MRSRQRTQIGKELGKVHITARKLLQARQEVGCFFDAKLFSDPAYSILLGLMAREEEGLATGVEECAREAEVPCTTAARWITLLEQRGLLERAEPHGGATSSSVKLTDQCHTAMGDYLRQVADVLAV